MALPELYINSPVPNTKAQIAALGAAVATTPAANTIETWTYVAAPPAGLSLPGQYHFVIDNEICIDVTGGGGTARQIVRGVEGSTVATHANGAPVIHDLTKEALQNIMAAIIGATPETAACMTRNAALTYAQNTWTAMPFDGVLFDAGGHCTTGVAAKYTCPVAGVYMVTAELYVASGAVGSELGAAIAVNGARVRESVDISATAGNSDLSQQVTGLVTCAAGDIIQIYYFTNLAAGALAAGLSVLSNMSVVLADQPVAALPLNNIAPNTAARAYRAAALTVNGPGPGKIPVDTVPTNNNPGGHMDVTTNHRYNVTQTGWYQVNGAVMLTTIETNTIAYIYKNGAVDSAGGSTNQQNASVSNLIFCTAGDYLELWVWTSGTDTLLVGPQNNYLSVIQVA